MASKPALTGDSIRFGEDFELDVRAYELRSAGIPLKLTPIPMELLMFLVERRGELVTREQIVERIWGKGVFLDTDNSINGAISRIRQVLRDDAAQPRFVQTVTGRGYRFIAPVIESSPSPAAEASVTPAPEMPPPTPPVEGLIGRKISHYRILDLLGGGGMGVVYKAEDLKLGRRVAIKFLPAELANDHKAFERLEREAQAASALDHRNICSIYELDEHEGLPFIVMQLLEGQTLQEQMEAAARQEKALPLNEILGVAIQVTQGLEAAHQKGIVHRDIKPANIFVTASGEAKILDFGLAKLMEAGGVEGDHQEDRLQPRPEEGRGFSRAGKATLSGSTLTRTGIHMGTAFYMSPEQVRGEKLDGRTDIFSLGLVLYEMATGQRAFPGRTTAVVHDAILHNSPVPLRELNSMLPAKLVATIDKCLEKEREGRWQSAAELRTALEEIQRAAAPSHGAARRKKKIAVATLALALMVAAATAYWWRHRPMAQFAFKNYRMTALTDSGNVALAAISPDGRYLAYADDEWAKQSLWLQQLATSTPVRVLGPVSQSILQGLRFTPDGNYLYYVKGDPSDEPLSLYRLPVLGGSPQKIVSDVDSLSSVDISPDGKQIVFTRRSQTENYLLIANADGTAERRVLTLKGAEIIGMPVWSPDAQTIAFGIGEGGNGNITCIAVISSQGGTERRILRKILRVAGMAWLPDQSGLVISFWPLDGENFSLWIMSYPEGSLRKVTSDLAHSFDVSLVGGGGSLVTVQKQVDSTLWVAPASKPSEAMPLREGAAREDGIWGVAWLPGGRLVFGIGDFSELWVVDRDGSNRQQLTHVNKTASNPSATAAGDTIVFARLDHTSRIWNIWAIDTDGSNLRQITSGSASSWRPEISPDGKWIVYASAREGPSEMSLSGGEPIKLDPKGGQYPTISPDGRWVAFEATDNHIEIVPSDGKASPRFLPFIDEPQAPNPFAAFATTFPISWTADGKAITYVRTKNGVSNIWAQPIDGSPARQLTNFTSMLIWSHSWSPDGKYLVMARGNLSRDAVMLTDVR